jgi:hypothetical protein
MSRFLKEMIIAHKFFTRKSQHYMLGNWSVYESKNYWFNTWAYPEKAKQYRNYLLNYPKAYIKFMWFSCMDYIHFK